MKKFAGALILLIVGTLISCPKPTGSPSKVWVVSTIAGGGNPAEFNSPSGVAVDASGNVYVADTNNHRIRKITLTSREVSTIAGSTEGFADDAGTSAKFDWPSGVAVDAAGNVYVADFYNHRIRRIILTSREVNTLAGGGNPAQFNHPVGVAVDSSGNVYVADYGNHRIRKITLTSREVNTLAGSGTAGSADGLGTAAQFRNPTGVAVDAKGNVYVADFSNNRIRKITSGGEVDTLAGTGTPGSKDGAGTSAQFNEPTGVALDAEGNVYVADSGSHLIRKITPEGVVSTIAGSGTAGFKDDAGTEAQFNTPKGVAVDAEGNIYVADHYNHRIRKIEYKVP